MLYTVKFTEQSDKLLYDLKTKIRSEFDKSLTKAELTNLIFRVFEELHNEEDKEVFNQRITKQLYEIK